MTKLNILICHLPERIEFLRRLSRILDPQLQKYKADVKVLVDDSRYKSIGKKRNDLVARVDSDYFCFCDDDDRISDHYIQKLLEGIERNVDCCSLKGIITEDGLNPKVFEHSIKYKAYETLTEPVNGVTYLRYPNHLNVIKTEIGRQFKFPEIKHEFGDANHGEDTSFATQVFKSGLLKTEHYIEDVIYYYDYLSKK